MFKKWESKTDAGVSRYERQTDIIGKALNSSDHNLDELIRLMRETGESSLYLFGTRLDNDYGFGSNDLGTAISVLPQDGPKAAEPGYHPGSTEVYIVFQGSLVIESLDRMCLRAHNYGQFDVLVIPPGQCHRVRNEPERQAASFIVKTNPHHKPGVVRCNDCTYYNKQDDCPVRSSWLHEKKVHEDSTSS